MIAHADWIAGLAKGLSVLEAFAPERQRLNASQVAARTGLTRAAARRHLLTLAELGYLEGEDGAYWLSPKVLRLAGAYLSSARLPRVLQPVLDRLALTLHEPCSAVVLDRDKVVIVARSFAATPPLRDLGWGDRSPGARSLAPPAPTPLTAYGLHQGARLAAHATSTGRVLLACLPGPELSAWLRAHAPLARLTARTVTEPAALRKLLAEVRRQDHCLATDEHELGVTAVAVPVRDLQGRAVAAINVVGTAERLRPSALEADLLPALRAAARELQPLV